MNDQHKNQAELEDTRQRLATLEARLSSSDRARTELQAIYEGMIDGLLIVDLETMKPVMANPIACQMLGYSEKEVRSLVVNDMHSPEQLPVALERFNEHAGRRSYRSEDVPFMRKDGGVLHVDITTSLITYEGRPCMMGFLRDVTNRRQIEDGLRRERRALRQLLRAVDHERQAIAYDIHDGLAQLMASAYMHFQAYEKSTDSDPSKAAKSFGLGMESLRQGLEEVRHLIDGVRPPVLDELGVMAAIGNLVREFRSREGPAVEFDSQVEFRRLPAVQENAIFRIVQEGLTNAWTHSESEKVSVKLVQDGDELGVFVRDWGIGFIPSNVGDDHFGIEGMRERARMLGGRAEIESKLGEGTCISVRVPLLDRNADGEH